MNSVTISKLNWYYISHVWVEKPLSLLVIKVGLSLFLHEVEAKPMYSVSWNSLGGEVISIRQLLKLRSRFDNSSTTDWDYENEVTIEKNVEWKLFSYPDVR